MASNFGPQLEEAIILCGGLATRLREVAADRPKALVDVRGRPLLEWLLLGLAHREGIRKVILATGHLGEMIEHHFGDSSWCGLTLSFSHEGQPLGTAGALRLASSVAQSTRLLVLNGDTYCRYDSGRLLATHVDNKAAATLWLSPVRDASRFGSVVVAVDGSIRGFHEKSAVSGPQLASAGVYLIERKVIAKIPAGRAVSLEEEVFPSLVGDGLFGVEGTGLLIDIGTPESLKSADALLAGELDGLDCD